MDNKIKTTNKVLLPSQFRKPRKRLIIFILLNALVPLIALSFYTYLGQRETTINTAKKDALYVAEVAANIYRERIVATKNILKTVSRLPEISGRQAGPCNMLMSNFLKEYQVYADLGVADRDGIIYCSGLPVTQKTSVKNVPWYQETIKNENFSAGLYQIEDLTGQESVSFGYPVALSYPLIENGKIQKVIFAALRLDWIQKTAGSFDLPENSTITVTDRNGTVLAHFPEGAKYVGTNQSDNSLIKTILAGGEKGSGLEVGFDGVERYYSYVKIQESLSSGDFYLHMGIPKSFLVANANRAFTNSLIIVLSIISLSVLIVLFSWKFFVDKLSSSS